MTRTAFAVPNETRAFDFKDAYEDFISDTEHFSRDEFLHVFKLFKDELNSGRIRAAEKNGEEWRVNSWVKQFILLGFKNGILKEIQSQGDDSYFEKDTLVAKKLKSSDKVRTVSKNVSIRDGNYIGPGVICMPPCFINIGSYIDSDSMIDSNTLIGSCAQIGRNVHISAGAQIGGVLEPIRELPVIIEDDVFVGGNCGIFDGTIIKKGAVIGAGTIITGSTDVYDLVKGKVYSRTAYSPLVVPKGALVVPGARQVATPFFEHSRFSIQTPLIVKYVDERNPWTRAEACLKTEANIHN